MKIDVEFSDPERDSIANTIRYEGVYISKNTIKRWAQKVAHPNRVPSFFSDSDRIIDYLNDVFKKLTNEEFLSFICLLVKEVKPQEKFYEETVDIETGELNKEKTEAAENHEAFIKLLNRDLHRHGILINFEGELQGISESTVLKGFKSNVFDLIEKFDLTDVKKLLENGYDHYKNGYYSDCVFNTGRSIEGVMKKILISITEYSEESEMLDDLRKTIGRLMKKLKDADFWDVNDPAYKTTDVFRDVFRNVSGHYSTSDEALKLIEFDRSEALFAYYMSLTLISYLLERLNDIKGRE